jgi:hypothetical protein
MTTVRIYQPSQTAMQSGKGKTKHWIVEYETKDPMISEPLMGWVASIDTRRQLHLFFPSLKEAIQFAKLKGLRYTICNPTQVSMVPKSYGINFTCPRMRAM